MTRSCRARIEAPCRHEPAPLSKRQDSIFSNGAHPDLQAEGYLQGNEPVELINLTPEGRMQFALPGVAPLCRVRRIDKQEEENIPMNLDTVFIEPDQRRFCLVWRGRAPLAALTAPGIEQLMIQNRMSA